MMLMVCSLSFHDNVHCDDVMMMYSLFVIMFVVILASWFCLC